MMPSVFLVITAILLSSAAADTVIADQREFDYFMFVRQWAGSFCHDDGSCPLVHRHGFRFTIHGLWPNYEDGSWPQFCSNEKFDEGKVKDLLPELEDEWPTFFNSEDSFWDHEWSKHGTCALKVLPDEHHFFGTVLDLHHRYDLSTALLASDIRPSDTVKYERTSIELAIHKAYGVDAVVHCDREGRLSEVWMCVGKDLLPFGCKPSRSTACQHVLIPTFPDKRGSGAAFEGVQQQVQQVQQQQPVQDSEQELQVMPAQQVEQVPVQQVQQRQGGSAGADAAHRDFVRTCIIASAGAVMVVIIAATLAVSAIKRMREARYAGASSSGDLYYEAFEVEQGHGSRSRATAGDDSEAVLSQPLLKQGA